MSTNVETNILNRIYNLQVNMCRTKMKNFRNYFFNVNMEVQ